MDKILETLQVISDAKFIALTVLIIIAIILFRKPIGEWIRKKLGLYTEVELKDFAQFSKTEMKQTSNIDSDFNIWKK